MIDSGTEQEPEVELGVEIESSTTERELRDSHRSLSPLDWEFRRYVTHRPEALDRSSFAVLDEDHPLLTYRRQPWPAFVGAAKLRELREASLWSSRLLRLVPERVFGNDPERIADFYGFDDVEMVRLFFEPPNPIEGAVSRGDFIDTPDGFKCIEFNMGANLGGWETGVLAPMTLGIPVIQRFVEQASRPIRWVDTVGVLFQHILEEAEAKGVGSGRRVNVAFSTYSESPLGRGPIFERYLNDLYASVRERLGVGVDGRALRTNEDELVVRKGELYYGDDPVHAVVEVDPGYTAPSTFQASKAGRVLLYNGPINTILTSKRNMALVSEHRDSDRFTDEEKERIHRYFPWTTQLLPRYVDYRGSRYYLPELLMKHRTRMILKESLNSGGKGVVLGSVTPQDVWEEAIDEAVESGDWLVQELVTHQPFLFQSGDVGCSVHDVIWGPFVFGDHYAGNVLRMQPRRHEGAVNLSLHATQGIIFEVD